MSRLRRGCPGIEPAAACGLSVWLPYEDLPWTTQAILIQGGAVALDLAADGRITARGVHADAVFEFYLGSR